MAIVHTSEMNSAAARVRNQSARRPRSRFFEIAHRISDRFGPLVAASFVEAIGRLNAGIDDAELRSAIASGNLNVIESAIRPSRLSALFLGGNALAEQLRRTAAATGRAGADVLTGVTGIEVGFNQVHPNVVMFAREQAATLVVQVTEDVREAVRIVLAAGQTEGLTTVQQARAIRQVVGLPPNWANAPMNLARELREGTFTASRRLSAIDKAQIRKRLREGTMTEDFIDGVQKRYADSLTNRRALNIARTETMRSANHGTREGWRQAREQGALPETARRMWIVTPDDRLRPSHAAIPGMNPDGVPIDGGTYNTPLGPSDGPPLETNCRCGEGLVFLQPGQGTTPTGTDAPIEETPIEVAPDAPGRRPEPTVPPTQTDEFRQRLKSTEEGLRGQDIETGVVYDASGNEILRKNGDATSIRFTDSESRTIRESGAVFTHNHPVEVGPSPTDIRLAVQHNLSEMRVVTDRWHYSIGPPEGGWQGIEEIDRAVTAALERNVAQFREAMGAGQLTRESAERAIMHEVWSDVSSELGWAYDRRGRRSR